MRHVLSGLTVLALVTLACDNPVAVDSDILQVRKAPAALELTNVASTPVYFFAADRGWLAAVDWVPCADPATCSGIDPRATRRMPLDSIGGWSESTSEIVVYHWRLVAGTSASGFVPDSMRALIVRIR